MITTLGDKLLFLTKTLIDVILFHAGTSLLNEQLVTAGGRVFSVAATGAMLEMAIERAYKGVESIKFTKMFHRKDIGRKCVRVLNLRQDEFLADIINHP